MRQWIAKWRLAPLFVMIALFLMGCGDPRLSTLIPQGEVAQKQYDLMVLSIIIMTIVLVVVFILFAYVVVKFRRKAGDNEIPEQVEGSHILEMIWTAIPILLILILAIPTVMQTFELSVDEEAAAAEDAFKIKVTAHQYWWEFEYPDHEIVTAQELYIPVNERVYVELEASDVIHSFWVPALAGKTDTNPGLTNTMWLKGDKEGIYFGKCAELCGASHALMDFKVRVVDEAEFTAWVDSMKNPAEPTTELAQQGQKVFENNCLQCHAVGANGGNMGPALTGFGDNLKIAGILDFDEENGKENLKKWISDPLKVKPGNSMPPFGKTLNEQELDALVEYLTDLK
jgi:cytochrome c oxidase subunit 2